MSAPGRSSSRAAFSCGASWPAPLWPWRSESTVCLPSAGPWWCHRPPLLWWNASIRPCKNGPDFRPSANGLPRRTPSRPDRPSSPVSRALHSRVLDSAVESVAREEMVRLQTGIAALDVIITISPMLGLLGTVSGLVTVFGTLGASQDLSDPSVIAAGIAEALYTTIAGLAVAIVAVIVHRYLDKRIESLSVRLEILAGQLITAWHRWGGPAAVNGPLPEMGPGDHWDPQEASGAPDSPAA
ncbi:MAG: MotA/TolQ/ExbB proton channel family protein [Verrucomicrobiales bacterium]